jgi:predicted membrane-bound spermidine synthase
VLIARKLTNIRILMSRKDFIIFGIIFIEGFLVLSSEVLIMRRFTPYVGNSIDITSIIIGLVLLPLSLGYFYGGQYASNNKKIRQKICNNFKVAGMLLATGFSLWVMEISFAIYAMLNISRGLQVALYMMIFLVYPTYLLAQTVPLISRFLSKKTIKGVTGKILFSSTLGSLIGSIATTLILTNLFGVTYSILIVLLLLLLASITLNKKLFNYNNFIILMFLVAYFLVDQNYKKEKGIYSDKVYSTMIINSLDEGKSKILSINNSSSAKVSSDPSLRFPYVKYIEDRIINIDSKAEKKKDILVLGAGGFTIGHSDLYNNYYFVDIDKELKSVSEKYFLQKSLPKNQQFIHQAARNILNRDKKYDIIIIDAYTNKNTVPYQLVTREFFKQVKDSLHKDAIAVFNILTSPNFSNKFSVRVDNTLRSVFSNIIREIIAGYSSEDDAITNILYIYKNIDSDNKIYTDDLNTSYLDK